VLTELTEGDMEAQVLAMLGVLSAIKAAMAVAPAIVTPRAHPQRGPVTCSYFSDTPTMDARLTREALSHHRMTDDMVALVEHLGAALSARRLPRRGGHRTLRCAAVTTRRTPELSTETRGSR
jgi:hypothetical protein